MNIKKLVTIDETILNDIADIVNEKNNTEKRYTEEQLVEGVQNIKVDYSYNTDINATSADLMANKNMYVKGKKITGKIKDGDLLTFGRKTPILFSNKKQIVLSNNKLSDTINITTNSNGAITVEQEPMDMCNISIEGKKITVNSNKKAKGNLKIIVNKIDNFRRSHLIIPYGYFIIYLLDKSLLDKNAKNLTGKITFSRQVFPSGKKSINLNNKGTIKGIINGQNMTVYPITEDIISVNECFELFSNYVTTILDLSNFDTSSVTNMNNMFYGCNALTTLDLSSFDTSKVTSMSAMFWDCPALTTLDLSSFDTSKVTNMSDMFTGCDNLTTLDLSNFDTSNVTDMSAMFNDCRALTTLDLSSFDTSKVTNMSWIFNYCNALKTVYCRTQEDAYRFKASAGCPETINFIAEGVVVK